MFRRKLRFEGLERRNMLSFTPSCDPGDFAEFTTVKFCDTDIEEHVLEISDVTSAQPIDFEIGVAIAQGEQEIVLTDNFAHVTGIGIGNNFTITATATSSAISSEFQFGGRNVGTSRISTIELNFEGHGAFIGDVHITAETQTAPFLDIANQSSSGMVSNETAAVNLNLELAGFIKFSIVVSTENHMYRATEGPALLEVHDIREAEVQVGGNATQFLLNGVASTTITTDEVAGQEDINLASEHVFTNLLGESHLTSNPRLQYRFDYKGDIESPEFEQSLVGVALSSTKIGEVVSGEIDQFGSARSSTSLIEHDTVVDIANNRRKQNIRVDEKTEGFLENVGLTPPDVFVIVHDWLFNYSPFTL